MDAWLIVLLAGAVICAVQAVRTPRLLAAAIWLAGVSALVSVALYLLGAHEVAVIELSVGAGLVTVLFVFAINIAGEDAMEARSIVPRPVALVLVIIPVLLLAIMTLPSLAMTAAVDEGSFAEMLWQQRGMDVLVQIVLIFAGVLAILGLLSDTIPANRPPLGGDMLESASHEDADALPAGKEGQA